MALTLTSILFYLKDTCSALAYTLSMLATITKIDFCFCILLIFHYLTTTQQFSTQLRKSNCQKMLSKKIEKDETRL